MESASQDYQPIQEVIDYCKDPKNNVSLFIIKSIDRFTRGGSDFYGPLKRQLEDCGVTLLDIYGVISPTKVNTLDHLGVQYKWSVYSPTRKSEILEAERAQDEIRDIMSRMIGAEVRYTRMGYYMRQPPFGFLSEKLETHDGKRCVLRPHPVESQYVLKMFDMRCEGFHDQQIVSKINEMGYTTRITYVRDKHDRTRIIKRIGGKPLDQKGLARFIQNPLYAGVNCEKWTNDLPVKCKFDGLVSMETFNKANRGKVALFEQDGKPVIYRKPPPEYLVKKGVRNVDFPYKKAVLCPECRNPLFGSAPRGRLGKYYPGYHCHRQGHYFRIPKKEFDETVERFVKNIRLVPEHIDSLCKAVLAEWDKRQTEEKTTDAKLDTMISGLQLEAQAIMGKIKLLSSESAIKYMEGDLMKVEEQIVTLTKQKQLAEKKKPTDMRVVIAHVKYFLENLDYLLLKQIDPIKKANFLGVLFDKTPTYSDLKIGTTNLSKTTGVNQLFLALTQPVGNVVISPGIEPGLPG